MTYSSTARRQRLKAAERCWPIHEVGRNADIFPPEAGRLLAAHSSLSLTAGHIHSNGRETKAHLEFAFKFFPEGYKPIYRRSSLRLGNGIDIDVKPNQAARSSTPTPCSRRTPRSSRSSRTCTRRACACVWKRSGDTTSDAELRRLRPQLGEAIRVRRRCGAAAAEGDDRSPHRLPRHDGGEQEPGRRSATGLAAAAARSRTCSSIWAIPCRSPTNSSRRRWPSGGRT